MYIGEPAMAPDGSNSYKLGHLEEVKVRNKVSVRGELQMVISMKTFFLEVWLAPV